jgi:hypothetical protein
MIGLEIEKENTTRQFPTKEAMRLRTRLRFIIIIYFYLIVN